VQLLHLQVSLLLEKTTLGTKPGERMMGQLERRTEAISGEFNSQTAANTTLMKWWHLELFGYILVSAEMEEGRKYLEGKLQCNVDVDISAHS